MYVHTLSLPYVLPIWSAKLPLSLCFSINAGLLCALSVVFAGHGVKALQEAGIFGTRPVAFFDFDWLGIHADAYSLAAQVVAIVAIVVLYGRSWVAEKRRRSEEHTSELQSLMRISYAVFCFNKKTQQ